MSARTAPNVPTPTPCQVEEDVPGVALTLRAPGEGLRLRWDGAQRCFLVEVADPTSTSRRPLRVPFDRLDRVLLESGAARLGVSEGQGLLPLRMVVGYRDERGRAREFAHAFEVEDLDLRAEVLDLCFRIAQTTALRRGDDGTGVYRDAPHLELGFYVLRRCDFARLDLELVRSVRPGEAARPVPRVEASSGYEADDAKARFPLPEGPPTPFVPSTFVSSDRVAEWAPGRVVRIGRRGRERSNTRIALWGLLLVPAPALLYRSCFYAGPTDRVTDYIVSNACAMFFAFVAFALLGSWALGRFYRLIAQRLWHSQDVVFDWARRTVSFPATDRVPASWYGFAAIQGLTLTVSASPPPSWSRHRGELHRCALFSETQSTRDLVAVTEPFAGNPREPYEMMVPMVTELAAALGVPWCIKEQRFEQPGFDPRPPAPGPSANERSLVRAALGATGFGVIVGVAVVIAALWVFVWFLRILGVRV